MFYCWRVGYGSEACILKCGSCAEDVFRWMTQQLEEKYPELKRIDYRFVCRDGGWTYSVDSGNIKALFALAGKQHEGPDCRKYTILDSTLVPQSTGLSSVSPGNGTIHERSTNPIVDDNGQKISKPPRYRYQVFNGEECFISPVHNDIDFSMDDIRKDVEDVWPGLSGTNVSLRCLDASVKISFTTKKWTMKNSSVAGLFDCFAKEVVRPNGDYTLILQLTIDHIKIGSGIMSRSNNNSTSGEDESECQTAKDSDTVEESSEHDVTCSNPEDVLSTSSAGLGTSSWVLPMEEQDAGSESSG